MALPGPSYHVASASTPFNIQQPASFFEVDAFEGFFDGFFDDETTANNNPDANGSDQEHGSRIDDQYERMEMGLAPGEEQETFMNDIDQVMNNMQQLVIDRPVPPPPPVCVVVCRLFLIDTVLIIVAISRSITNRRGKVARSLGRMITSGFKKVLTKAHIR
jgi:hypothetical protein